MRKTLLSLAIGFSALLGFENANSQSCTPVNCLASLPPYGGICDTVLAVGRVGTAYSDFESWVHAWPEQLITFYSLPKPRRL